MRSLESSECSIEAEFSEAAALACANGFACGAWGPQNVACANGFGVSAIEAEFSDAAALACASVAASLREHARY
jgi:hypothetical protein